MKARAQGHSAPGQRALPGQKPPQLIASRRNLGRNRALALLGLIALTLCLAAGPATPVEAADGAYGGLRLPFAAGQARIVVRVSEHGAGRHAADFGMSYEDVLAMHGGQVAWTGSSMAQYGIYVVVDHLDGYCAIYAHFDKLGVREGQLVQQGQRLGLSGNTGNSTGPHLHAAVFHKLSGVCGPANAWTEVQMLFDEGPGRELRAGDWVISANRRPPPAAALLVSPADSVAASPAGVTRPATIAASPNGLPHSNSANPNQHQNIAAVAANAAAAAAGLSEADAGRVPDDASEPSGISWDSLFGWLMEVAAN